MSYNPAILEAAGGHLGTDEWPGARHNPAIQSMFAASGHNPNEPDETPWCAAFVGAVLAELGLPHTGRLNARSYLDWGVPVSIRDVKPGDICVLWRGSPDGWQGHVAFVVRFDRDQVILRGGNQGNSVSDAPYSLSRVLGWRRAVVMDESRRPILREGARGAFVVDLQGQLQRLGYFAGRLDGNFGPLTRAAVLAFQADGKLDVDGIVGGATWGALTDAPPRVDRDVDASSLRDAGSRTIRGADHAQAGTAATVVLGAGTAMVERAEDAVSAIEQAQGLADRVAAVVGAAWPALAILLVGLVVMAVLSRIKAARIEDARTGRNLAR